MTEELLIKWLKDDSAVRCVLVEVKVQVGGVETTRYLSNKGYVTGTSDVPANTSYSPVLAGGVQFTESLSLDGSPSLSYGDIELSNMSGSIDSWLEDVWTNREIKIFIGDVRWVRADFYKIFDGIVVGVDSRRRDRINLKLGDKLQRLNTPVSEKKLGGATSNKDRLIPLLFGECHNITPLLVDPAQHEYQVHDGAIESIIEVRDNGVPVAFTPFVTTGKFRLNQTPVGTITCSAQGDKPSAYANDATTIIKRIVTDFGTLDQRFTVSDLDTVALDVFATSNQQPIGIYMSDRTNVLEACNRIASSVGARITVDRNGKLYLVKLDLPRSTAGTTVTASDMIEFSLQVNSMPTVVAGVKLGYCKNWTVQSSLQTGIPSEHIELFAQDWLTTTQTDQTVATRYKLFAEPEMSESLLLREVDAVAEATRRLNLFKVQRRVLRYTGLQHLLLEKLGGSQTLKHSRYGLSDGVSGQIISLTTDWLNPRVDVEVIV